MEAIVKSILRKVFPLKPRGSSALSLEELQARYGQYAIKYLAIYMPIAFACSFAFWYLLDAVGAQVASQLPSARFALVQSGIYWLPPALLLGFVAPAKLVDLIAARLFGVEQLRGYKEFEEVRYQIGPGAGVFMAIAFPILCSLFVALGLNHYVLVQEDRMVISGWMNITTRVLPYDGLVSIKTAPVLIAPIGSEVMRREFVLQFSNGQRWNTDNAPMSLRPQEKPRMVAFISQASGIPITEVPVLNRGDL
jgi:hypothetical protein